jgi:hypothetical protein
VVKVPLPPEPTHSGPSFVLPLSCRSPPPAYFQDTPSLPKTLASPHCRPTSPLFPGFLKILPRIPRTRGPLHLFIRLAPRASISGSLPLRRSFRWHNPSCFFLARSVGRGHHAADPIRLREIQPVSPATQPRLRGTIVKGAIMSPRPSHRAHYPAIKDQHNTRAPPPPSCSCSASCS